MRWSWKRPSVPEKYQPWLTENQWWINFLALALAAFAVVRAFQKSNWAPWMGFSGKTTWDWLSLLGVPLTLALLGYILQRQERSRAERVAKEEILQVYFDRLSTLLIDKNILAIAKNPMISGNGELLDASINVIRARTLSILRRFEGDPKRIDSVIRFLRESGVFSKAGLHFDGADFIDADLRDTNLGGISLREAKLTGANLTYASLSKANLQGAHLREANLVGAQLRKANLARAYLAEANLTRANLAEANLQGAHLREANLQEAYLRGANLRGAYLKGANLQEACLSGANLQESFGEGNPQGGANLERANLQGTDLTNIQWDDKTQWPDPTEVAKARNIPEGLKQQLGLTATPLPPAPDPY